MEIKLPIPVKELIHKLNQNGHTAYAVGGCIRDAALNLEPNDWDITTSARPEVVKSLFRRTVDTGLKHGTVTVMVGDEGYEITTYRIDGDYSDGRRPDTVSFTGDLSEDLKRRDFTVNAMAYNETEGLVDIFDGLSDLRRRVIRCVGSGVERFEEDALRMLRAIRFSAKLSFTIDPDTEAAIQEKAHLIRGVSGERIHDELTKILISDNPHYMEKVVSLGLMQYIIPEFMINVGLAQINRHHMYPVDRHTYETLKNIDAREALRWTMFLHDIGKGTCISMDEQGVHHFYGHPEKSVEIAKKILSRLHFDNKTRDEILHLIAVHDYRVEPTMKAVRRAVFLIGDEYFPSYLQVTRADVLAQNTATIEEKLNKLKVVEAYYQEILQRADCTSMKDLRVGGKDLIEMGIEEGRTIGIILNQLLEEVVENPEMNERSTLLKRASEISKHQES